MNKIFDETISKRVDEKQFILARLQADFTNAVSGGSISISTLYSSVMTDIGRWIGIKFDGSRFHDSIQTLTPETVSIMSIISRMIIPLQPDPDKWNALQFIHVRNFPKVTCIHCEDTICFCCGEAPYHETLTCHKYMKNRILRLDDAEIVDNLKWKLANSKRCPNCSILINRDEGCNKVDCLFCGHVFCWNCEGNFENGDCSFYRCMLDRTRSRVQESNAAASLSTSPTKFELGVPNVFRIEANRASRSGNTS